VSGGDERNLIVRNKNCKSVVTARGTKTPTNKKASVGIKYDHGKSRMDLISPAALLLIGDVLAYGAELYGEHNWKAVDNLQARYYAACLRHLAAWQRGEKFDDKSRLSHLGHAMTNVMYLIAYEEGDIEPWTTQKQTHRSTYQKRRIGSNKPTRK